MSIRSLRGNREISPLTICQCRRWPAPGRRGAEAGDVRRGEVGLAHSSCEAGEQSARSGVSGAKERGQGKRGTATHAPDAEPGKYVTEAVTRAGSCEAAEERTVYRIVPPPDSRGISSTKYRIALLDDDANITESLKEILSNDYYQVDTYDNLKKLTQAVATNPYDAYVLDWIIGDETSFKLVKAIRSSKNKNAMIIVLTGQLSGIKDDEIVKSIHDYDIVGPYEKPIKSGIIKSNIEKYFAR